MKKKTKEHNKNSELQKLLKRNIKGKVSVNEYQIADRTLYMSPNLSHHTKKNTQNLYVAWQHFPTTCERWIKSDICQSWCYEAYAEIASVIIISNFETDCSEEWLSLKNVILFLLKIQNFYPLVGFYKYWNIVMKDQ